MSYDQNMLIINAMPAEQQPALIAQVEAEKEIALSLASMTDEEAAAITVFGINGLYQKSISDLDEAAIAEEKRAMEDVIAKKQTKEVEAREEIKTMEFRNTPEYINAYAEYIKSGDNAEVRALTSTNDTTPHGTGTVAVPEVVYDIVKTAWNREGIMSRVRKAYLKGNLKVGFEISGSDAAIHAEGDSAVSEETLVLGTVNLVPQSIKKWISISDEVMDLRGEAFLEYIYDELAYRIAKKAADQVVAKIEACGTVATTTCPRVPKHQATTAALGDIAQAMALLSDEAANPVVIMNKATWGTYKALQAGGNFGYDPFEGLEVVFNNSITSYAAATTGVTYAIVGDLDQGALANFPNGDEIDFKFDELTDMTKDLVRVLGREFVGIGVVANDAFVKITK
jgi:HK97 family phage major capsid protein